MKFPFELIILSITLFAIIFLVAYHLIFKRKKESFINNISLVILIATFIVSLFAVYTSGKLEQQQIDTLKYYSEKQIAEMTIREKKANINQLKKFINELDKNSLLVKSIIDTKEEVISGNSFIARRFSLEENKQNVIILFPFDLNSKKFIDEIYFFFETCNQLLDMAQKSINDGQEVQYKGYYSQLINKCENNYPLILGAIEDIKRWEVEYSK